MTVGPNMMQMAQRVAREVAQKKGTTIQGPAPDWVYDSDVRPYLVFKVGPQQRTASVYVSRRDGEDFETDADVEREIEAKVRAQLEDYAERFR